MREVDLHAQIGPPTFVDHLAHAPEPRERRHRHGAGRQLRPCLADRIADDAPTARTVDWPATMSLVTMTGSSISPYGEAIRT
ncbi:MAG TPA: hypothetical protein VLM79_11375, partial [Kofleriaceae bacterium]|nr:hypothetical protein [Kofleriaceae bacterium]